MFLEKLKTIRMSDECMFRLRELVRLFPDRYDSKSHAVRVAVMKLYNEEVRNELKCR